jgi:hypothetical protein
MFAPSSHESAVHGFKSAHGRGAPPQTPSWQLSGMVQNRPSSHEAPLPTGMFTQPKKSLHVSVVHGFESSHAVIVPTQLDPPMPSLWQTSPSVQNWPSSQLVPLG